MKKILILALTAAFLALGGAEKFFNIEDTTPGKWFLFAIEHSRAFAEKGYREKLDKLAPYEERVRLAEEYHKLRESRFYSDRLEDAAIEKALNWKKGDFTWHNNRFFTRTGCTSWIITPDSSSTGSCIVQKNRDYRGQNLLTFRIYRAAPGRFKIAVVGDLWSSGAGAVMNEKGLMIVQNDGPGRYGHPRQINLGCTAVLRMVAERCANLDEAAKMIRELHDSGICRSASIYLLADLNSGMVLEATAVNYADAPVKFAFEARANEFMLPGMNMFSRRTRKGNLGGTARCFDATDFLRNTLLSKGKISPADLTKLARQRDPQQEKEGFRQVCMKNTLASTMFVPDRMYPEYLSATFVALGPPRHTVFLPVPMGLSLLPETLINGQWGTKALTLAKQMPLDHKKLPEFEALEKKFSDEFFAVREKARLLLLAKKRAEAVKMLDELFIKQYEEAKKFMDKLLKPVSAAPEKK